MYFLTLKCGQCRYEDYFGKNQLMTRMHLSRSCYASLSAMHGCPPLYCCKWILSSQFWSGCYNLGQCDGWCAFKKNTIVSQLHLLRGGGGGTATPTVQLNSILLCKNGPKRKSGGKTCTRAISLIVRLFDTYS